MNYVARDNVIRRFNENAQIRCLVMSKVGTVGLNLTVADSIIFLVTICLIGPAYLCSMLTALQDQQWSYADENQAVGRIYRQGQTRPVSVYHMLAAGTVDYYMAASARGKAMMSEAFTMTEKQKSGQYLVSQCEYF